MGKIMFDNMDTILSVITQPIFIHDENFKVIYANKAYIKAAKKPLAKILDHVYWMSFPKYQRKIKAAPAINAIEISKGVFYKWHSFSTYPVASYSYTVNILEDVTITQVMVNEILEGKESFKNLVKQTNELVFLCDNKGRLINVNKAAYKSLGYSKKDLMDLSIFDIEKTLTKQIVSRIWCSAKLGLPIQLLGCQIRKNGTEFPVELHMSLIPVKSQFCLLVISRNLTAQLALESNLKQHIAFEAVLADIRKQLRFQTDLNILLQNVVIDLGNFANLDRCFIVLLNEKRHIITNVKEWCSAEAKSYLSARQAMKLADFPWLTKQLDELKVVMINDVEKLPRAALACKRFFQSGKIGSVLIIPIAYEKKLFGCIGFERVKQISWQPSDIAFLTVAVDVLGQGFSRKKISKLNGVYKQELEFMLYKTIEAVARLVEKRDPYTAAHQYRVAALAAAIAKKMKLNHNRIKWIYLGALIHDIGKIHVPAEILCSPTKLSALEFAIIKTHPQVGYDIVKHISSMSPLAKMISQHHERLDGSGYPEGLKGKQISLEARILAVADVYEAMSSHRPYRPKLKKQDAVTELETNAGILYDKKAVQVCIKLFANGAFRFPNEKDFSFDIMDSVRGSSYM